MKLLRQIISITIAVTMLLLGVPLSLQAQTQQPYRLSDKQVKQIIQQIESRANTFRRNLDRALDRSRLNGTQQEDEINARVKDFENATDNLRERFNDNRSIAEDVQGVMNSAYYINDFLNRNYLNRTVQTDWSQIRRDLDRLADAYNVTWSWDGRYLSPVNTQLPYRLSDREVEQLLNRIDTRADRYKDSLDRALDRSRLNGTQQEDEINKFVGDFKDATKQLRDRFNSRTSVAKDVESVLNRADMINDFMRRHNLNRLAQDDWSLLRGDLEQLARVYNVSWNWNQSIPVVVTAADMRMTGTYRLNLQRSDNPQTVAERATRRLPFGYRQQAYDDVLQRISSPDELAVERRGQTVSLASTLAPKSTLYADGQPRLERTTNGRDARVTVQFKGEQLIISSSGDRAADFEVTFTPLYNGSMLLVTRKVYTEQLRQPVIAQSYYDKTSEVAQWDVYRGASDTGMTYNEYIVSNGTEVIAVLNTDLSTKQARENDRFLMTVRSPAQFEGALIAGYVTGVKRSGRITGRSEMTLNFENIRLSDGRTYKFAGLVESVRTVGGENVRVDNEGAVREGDSRTSTTAKRTAAGAAIGAIIGAIAGGGKGAAIGAAIGAGTGAGSVYVQGRDDLEIKSGTEILIRASAPKQVQ